MRRWGWLIAVVGFLSVVVMPAAVGWFVWQRLPPQKDVTVFASTFGDIVGPLFAALAFAGLIYTALMQREELSLQREELRETRAELTRTADAQEASEKALQAQVDTAKLVAKLNAATALLEHNERMRAALPSRGVAKDQAAFPRTEKAISEARTRITAILQDLEQGSVTVVRLEE